MKKLIIGLMAGLLIGVGGFALLDKDIGNSPAAVKGLSFDGAKPDPSRGVSAWKY